MSNQLAQVFYFIPEDGETVKQMNCFIVRKSIDTLTLRDIRNNFPVPGDYHFRFHYSYKANNVKVWLDLPSEDSTVPSVEREVWVKATRLSWTEGISDFSKTSQQSQSIKKIEAYLMQQDAEKSFEQQSMGQEALSMFSNIASKAKNVLGGVATQVANSMPQPVSMGAMPADTQHQMRQQQNQNRQQTSQGAASHNQQRQQQVQNPTFDDLF